MRGGESEWRSTAPLGGSRTTRNSSRTATTPRPGVTWGKSRLQDRHRQGHAEPLGPGGSEGGQRQFGPQGFKPPAAVCSRAGSSLHSEEEANATEGPCFRKPNCSLFGNSTLISFWETTPPTSLNPCGSNRVGLVTQTGPTRVTLTFLASVIDSAAGT